MTLEERAILADSRTGEVVEPGGPLSPGAEYVIAYTEYLIDGVVVDRQTYLKVRREVVGPDINDRAYRR